MIATSNDAATGVSLGWGPSASLAAQNAVTLSMDPYGDGKFPGYDDAGMNAAWIAGHRAMSQEDRAEATMLFAGRGGIRTALRFSDLLTAIPDSTVAYPDTTLGAQLAASVRLLRAGAGIRIIHVPFSGDFDTHEDHLSRHNNLMTELDGALDAFLQELTALGHDAERAARDDERVRPSRQPELQRARPRHRDRRAAWPARSTPACTARTRTGRPSTPTTT